MRAKELWQNQKSNSPACIQKYILTEINSVDRAESDLSGAGCCRLVSLGRLWRYIYGQARTTYLSKVMWRIDDLPGFSHLPALYPLENGKV